MSALGNSPQAAPLYYTVGQLAKMAGVPVRRVRWWVERGWLQVDFGVGAGPGARRLLPASELSVAAKAATVCATFGVAASDALFAEVRRAA